jgi:ATP-dependent DNA ligase
MNGVAKSDRTPPIRRRVELVPPPIWVKPQLAKLVEKAPDGPDWLHEIKFDGYRMHARLDGGRVQILTRRGNDWTDKYPAIAKSIAGLRAHNAYLDGELCGVLPDGRTAFNLIQNATDTGEGSLVFFSVRPAALKRRELDRAAAGGPQDPVGISAARCAELAAIQ